MAAGSRTGFTPDADHVPVITACESCPGRAVFTERDNTEGWIASDTTVPITR